MNRLIPIVCAAFVASGCGPRLHVTHADPTTGTSEVWIDGRRAGVVERGDTMTTRVERGVRRVRVQAVQRSARATESGAGNDWHPRGEPWTLVVDEDLYITLTTPSFRHREGEDAETITRTSGGAPRK